MPRVAPATTLNLVSRDMPHHLVRSPSTPQGLALRYRIVLAAAAGQSNQAIAAGWWHRAKAVRAVRCNF